MSRHNLDRDRLDIYFWFFCLFTVLSLAGVVSWLSLTPRNPHFRLSGSQFTILDSKNHSVRGNISVPNNPLILNLEVFNPNKRMGIYYSDISIELYTGGALVGANTTPAFNQGYKNTTVLQILIQPREEFWQVMNGGNVDFLMRVETAVRFRIMKWKTKVHQISYEEQFSKGKSDLNGSVSGRNYTEMQNASKFKIRS
ncbi:hypothetical protein ACS0TY_031906 [Phlomoides rotata]